MWVKVLKKFKDKHNHEVHEPGEKMRISRERYEEIVSVGKFVEEISEKDRKEDITDGEKQDS